MSPCSRHPVPRDPGRATASRSKQPVGPRKRRPHPDRNAACSLTRARTEQAACDVGPVQSVERSASVPEVTSLSLREADLRAAGPLSAIRAAWANPRVKRGVRLAISAALLAFLFMGVQWGSVLEQARHLRPAVAALVVAVFGVQLFVSSWKWQWALRIHDLHFPYPFLTRVLFIGFFLNNFLPTSIGGDAYRIYRTLPGEPPRSRAISAVLLERVVGICAFELYSQAPLARAYVGLAGAGIAMAIGVFALLKMRLASWRNGRYLSSRWITPITENLRSIAQARSEWIPLVALSLLFQAQAVLVLYGLFNALDAPVSLAQAALIAAAAGVATVIPLSINGLGIVEATIASTAVALGVSYEAGLLVAVLIRILVLPLTLVAGLLYAFEPVHVRTVSAERDLFPPPPEYRNLRRTG
jgi:glycosyltransferase 2 family protein